MLQVDHVLVGPFGPPDARQRLRSRFGAPHKREQAAAADPLPCRRKEGQMLCWRPILGGHRANSPS